MITILTGDKVSSGDLFIVDRGIKLLKHFLPKTEILKLKRWEPVDDKLDMINKGTALILLGGPAIDKDIYPEIYPLVKNLNYIKVPIIAMGLGSYLSTYTKCKEFKFNETSKPLILRLIDDYPWIGIRDYITQEVLINSGINNGNVIGCPGWYNLENIGKQIKCKEINSVSFAAGARHFNSRKSFVQQCEVMKFIGEYFPKARKYCVFQDSLENDDLKSPEDIRVQRELATEAEKLGYETVNCTYNLSNMIDCYKNSDLLISYRVHSHICMLTMGKPSILVSEDCRGIGMNDFIGLKNFIPFPDDGYIEWVSGHNPQAGKPNDYFLFLETFFLRLQKLWEPTNQNKYNKTLVLQIEKYLRQEIENEFSRYAGIHNIIQSYFKKMEEFIKTIPV